MQLGRLIPFVSGFLMHLTPNLREKVNILMVDDLQRNLDALAVVLDNPEYNLVQATSGAQALERLGEKEFAVVLLDVMMPEMDGFQTAQKIRELPKCGSMPIVFVSAVADEMNFIYRGYRSGAIDYIVKPIDSFVVQAKVAVFVELFRTCQCLQLQLDESRALCRKLEIEKNDERKSKEDLIEQVRAFNASFEERLKPSVCPSRSKFFLFRS